MRADGREPNSRLGWDEPPDNDTLALWQTTHEAETGCTRRLPCRTCDEQMRRLWYGDAYSDEDDLT